jgi:hypothetical protein
MRSIKTSTRRMRFSRQLTLPRFAIAASVTLTLSFGISACEKVATYTEPSLVRFIDASYIAPAANAKVESQLIAADAGAGTITPYATVPASQAALIQIAAATGGSTLVSTSGTLLPGHQHSVFLTDNGAAPSSYGVTVLEDQQIAAAGNQSAFRFLNQAPKTGAVDIYMVPAGVALADAVPLVTDLPVGGTAGYVSFTAQTVTMVVTPTGLTKPSYTSSSIPLIGGEVRTALIMDAQLTSNPPVLVSIADDAGPVN